MAAIIDDARDRGITELAASEHRLARDLAATKQLLHSALGLAHERERRLELLEAQHSRLRHDYRRLREPVYRVPSRLGGTGKARDAEGVDRFARAKV